MELSTFPTNAYRSNEDYSPCFETPQYVYILGLIEDVECH
jgi:hypothetical protein